MAAGVKRKKSKSGSGWSWRLAGVALCAFFALGVVTGLSQSGRLLARRIEELWQRLPHSSRSELIPTAYNAFFKSSDIRNIGRASPRSVVRREPIALAKHPDRFYELDSDGDLFGPVSPADTPDLPVLSGGGIEHAAAAQLLEYAGELIRAEAALAAVVSEMRVTSDGETRLYLDRPQLVIVLAPGGFPLQLSRAAKVLAIRRERGELVRMIDMTVPGEAIVYPQAVNIQRRNDEYAIRIVRPLEFMRFHGSTNIWEG